MDCVVDFGKYGIVYCFPIGRCDAVILLSSFGSAHIIQGYGCLYFLSDSYFGLLQEE